MTSIDIVKQKKYILSFTFISIAISFLILITIPFNKSIEFTGGFVFEVSGEVDEKVINEISQTPVQIYKINSTCTIKVPYVENNKFEEIHLKLKELYTVNSASMVAPSMTSSLVIKACFAVLLSVVTIFVYLFLRFNFYYGIGSVATILHDALLSIAFIKVMQIELSMTTIAAILTIIGYSVNDTVIIYDKIRSHLHIKSKLKNVINSSILETLPRTIGTSLTTILSIIPVAIFTQGEIHNFATIVIFGIVVGTISSIAVSSLSLLPFEKKIHKILEIKHNLQKTSI